MKVVILNVMAKNEETGQIKQLMIFKCTSYSYIFAYPLFRYLHYQLILISYMLQLLSKLFIFNRFKFVLQN